MVKSNSSKLSTKQDDVDLLKSDIASFASSLGLSTSQSYSGFNDVDFRKTKANKPPKKKQKPEKVTPQKTQNPKNVTLSKKNGPHVKSHAKPEPKPKPKPKPSVLSLEDGNKEKGLNKFRNVPKVPLMKASALGVWFEDVAELEAKVIGEGKKLEIRNVEEWKGFVEKKREMGERLMAQYAQDYESSRGQSSDIKMLVSTQRSGTAADKVSAFSVLVGDNPIANLRSLDALLGMVTSKVGKRHALTGFEALQELFIASLLPDHKLKTLIQRPLNHIPETKDGYSLLLFWYWEECLKQRYERFVVALEEASRDMLPALKNKALKSIYVLLSRKSEQERRLLSALINKLGDPDNKAASNADFHLSNLLSDHPNMKAVVIDEVDSFLFRPHLGSRSQYHAVNFLSQIRLTNKGDGPKVAKRLIDVYFALFKVLISGTSSKKSDKSGKATPKEEKSKGLSESHVELDSRLLSALLTGVNRAFPFVSSDEADDIVDVQTPVLFQLVHSKNFNVGVQALMLLDKISSKNQIASDRFYRALYSKLLLPAAMNTSKAEMFIALLLRAMKRDVNLKRVTAFSKRLLQIALQQPPQYACACLFLLSELLKARPPLWNVVLQNESIDEELEHFEDVIEETDNKPSTVSNKQGDIELVQNGEGATSDTISSESEDDLPVSSEDDDSDDGETEDADFLLAKNEMNHKKSKSMYANEGLHSPLSAKKSSLPGGYDPRHREPSYCNADRASWWELLVLASHAHPSVATMAKTLLSGAHIVYNGNPLNDLSLTAFLDKFMEKKPKQSTWHGASQIEPAKQMDVNKQLIGSEILSLAEADVPPEDLVFHKFYTNKMSSSTKQKKKKKSADEEAAEELFDVDGGDESDSEEIENLLDSADQTMESDSDYDYDDLDKVANEDDEDLLGDVSDAEMEILSDMGEEDADAPIDDVGNDDDGNDLQVGDVDDVSDVDEDDVDRRKRKRKTGGKSGVSPFASYEEFEHLMEDDDNSEKKPTHKKSKSKKRKKVVS
ncbi:CCAAT/enhancer-binding protein zeta [Abrus precatorius]|uniref:CCAAT/enhancer-binding protein zeta n=1 Tax=Abrus precatorius TaxID=3816 RepID=A0A8B8K3K4_ABRPR|nr:CCAAT/enhancer-binding protein zeta [Abrus precatorius]